MKRFVLCFLLLSWLLLLPLAPLHSQSRTNVLSETTDPRGEPELIVCSQNLENYGSFADYSTRMRGNEREFAEKEKALIKRFIDTGCDVIAVQEIIASSAESAKEALERLAHGLRLTTNRFFEARVGESNDRMLHIGFLVARDRARILNTVSYARVELPQIADRQRPRGFSRGPFEIQLLVQGRDGSPDKTVNLVNMHFKSMSGRNPDPANLEWETYRMEMSEALRRIVRERHRASFESGETILIVLGDRNSHPDSASAHILKGTLTLAHFEAEGPCRLSKRGKPLCQKGTIQAKQLFSVLTGDPVTKLQPGTILYAGNYYWIDDILMPAYSLPYAWERFDSEGRYAGGVLYTPKEASDHGLVHVTLNW